jgi:hypothetical protein
MNQNKIADSFNNYFLSIADFVTSGINQYTSTSINNPTIYLADVFNRPFTKMSRQYASIQELQKL